MEGCLLLVWATCVCFAFVGYGKALFAACKVRHLPWAAAGAVGVSLVVALGGLLELAGYVRAPVLAGIILAGDVLFAWTLPRDRVRLGALVRDVRGLLTKNKTAAALLILLIALLAVRVGGNLQARYFYGDDVGAYLSFPAEMLQLGTLPSDPFSERRITSGLAGGYFLQTLTVLASDSRTIRFIDWGLGSILFAGIVFAIGGRLKLSLVGTTALALLIFVLPLRRTNATMVMLPAALFGALFFLEMAEELEDLQAWLRPLLIGITAAAISTLKATYVPAALLACVLYYAGRLAIERRVSTLARGGICALAIALSLFPWMLDQKLKEGTFLFPIFGKGYEASAYGTVPLPSGGHIDFSFNLWVRILALLLPLLVAIVTVFIAHKKQTQANRLVVATFSLAMIIGGVAVALATGGDSMERYALPFIAPGFIIFIALAVRWSNQLKRRPLWLNAAFASYALWLAAIGFASGIQLNVYRDYMMDFGLSPAPGVGIMPFEAGIERKRVAALQATVPPGEPILEHLYVSYSLDFKRNPIFIGDFLGLAGPSPGMPVGKGPELLRLYLLQHSIRFIAFTYGRGRFLEITPGFTLRQLVDNPKIRGRHTWMYVQNKVAYDVQTNLDALSQECFHTYDDGEACVLDLRSRPPAQSPSKRVS